MLTLVMRTRVAASPVVAACIAIMGCAARPPAPAEPPPHAAAKKAAFVERAAARVDGAVALSPNDIVRDAVIELEIEPAGDELQLAIHGSDVAIVVRGESDRQAHARCLALVRATLERAKTTPSAARAALEDEHARLRAELTSVEASLRDASATGGAPATGSAADELARALAMTATIEAAKTAGDALAVSGAPELLLAFARAAVDADLAARLLIVDGRGSEHPDVRRAQAVAARANARFEAQRQTELRYADRLRERARHASPRATAASVREAAIADAVEASNAEAGFPSESPLLLRLVLLEYAAAERALAPMAATYGEKHPSRVVAEETLKQLATELSIERDRVVKERGRDEALDRRPARVDDLRARYVAAAARLQRYEDDRAKLDGRVALTRGCDRVDGVR